MMQSLCPAEAKDGPSDHRRVQPAGHSEGIWAKVSSGLAVTESSS